MAIELTGQGAKMMVNPLHEETSRASARLFAKTGGEADVMVGDVGDPKLAEELVESTVFGYGRLDILGGVHTGTPRKG